MLIMNRYKLAFFCNFFNNKFCINLKSINLATSNNNKISNYEIFTRSN